MRLVVASLVALAGAAGCSGTSARPRSELVSGPFTPELAAFFDDSVDYVENAEDLGGRVAADWRRQIDGAARNADIIVVVRVETVTSGSESSSAGSYRLTVVGTRAPLKGALPEDRHVDLRVGEGEVGYNTVRGNLTRLQAREWLAFVRWYDDADNQPRPHWHLTPSSAQAVQRAQDAIGYLDPSAPRSTVITTTTSN